MTEPPTRFSATVGVNPGYSHANETPDPVGRVAAAWAKHAEAVFIATGVYVSANISATKTVYRTEWGCPPGGEDTVTVTGLYDIARHSGPCDWRRAVSSVSRAVGEELRQNTIWLEFSTSDVVRMVLPIGRENADRASHVESVTID